MQMLTLGVLCAVVVCGAVFASAVPSPGERKVVRDTVWELTWQDEFNGTALNTSNWTPGQNFNDSLMAVP